MPLFDQHVDEFWFSSITWHEVNDQVNYPNLNSIRQTIKSKLSLSNYGSGVKEIGYIFVAQLPSNSIHGETLRFYKAKKEVFIQKKLPYELVEAYESPKVLHMMAATYLQSLQDLASKRKIEDFDATRLVADVRALFAEQGWLASTEQGVTMPG